MNEKQVDEFKMVFAFICYHRMNDLSIVSNVVIAFIRLCVGASSHERKLNLTVWGTWSTYPLLGMAGFFQS